MTTSTPTKLLEMLRGREGELFEVLRLLESDKQFRRLPRKSTPKVVLHNPAESLEAELTPPGSITIFMAPADSPFLEDVTTAFSTADRGRQEALQKIVTESAASRSTISLIESMKELTADRTYADLNYGSKALARNLGLPNRIPFGTLTLPYNGGDLDDRKFELVEYTREGIKERLGAVIIRRPPVLTAAEREALDKVPADLLEINIGSSPLMPMTLALVTIAAFVAINAITLGPAPSSLAAQLRIELAEESIRELGPLASAQELLALRQRLLSGPS